MNEWSCCSPECECCVLPTYNRLDASPGRHRIASCSASLCRTRDSPSGRARWLGCGLEFLTFIGHFVIVGPSNSVKRRRLMGWRCREALGGPVGVLARFCNDSDLNTRVCTQQVSFLPTSLI